MTKKWSTIIDLLIHEKHHFSEIWLLNNQAILQEPNIVKFLKCGFTILMKGNRNFELETKRNLNPFFNKREIQDYKSNLIQVLNQPNRINIHKFISSIEALGISDILLLMGQKTSSTSIVSIEALPPSNNKLIAACFKPYNTYISQIEKQLDKHAGRADSLFWPKLDGNSDDKKTKITNLIHYFLDHIDWWNIYCHYQHDYVFEIRIESGYGMRWSKNGEHFIGFLEPYISYENKF